MKMYILYINELLVQMFRLKTMKLMKIKEIKINVKTKYLLNF